MSDKQENLDWNDFAGDYIKAENVKEFPVKFVVLGINKEEQQGKNRLVAEIEYGERSWKFDLNKTNRDFLASRFHSPAEVIGKVLVCDRIKVQNPTTKAKVWSLIIDSVE